MKKYHSSWYSVNGMGRTLLSMDAIIAQAGALWYTD